MTEALKFIQEFLKNDATLGNLSLVGFVIFNLVLKFVNRKLAKKNTDLEAVAKVQEASIKAMVSKMSNAMLAMSNMFTVAFANSKLDVKTKLYLQEQHDNLYKLLEGLTEKVEKVEVEVKPEVVEVKALEEEKSVLDKIKEDL